MKTLIAVVLDASSSMEHMKLETVDALNKFIKEQQAVPGEALLTIAKFDTTYRLLRNGEPLKDVKPVTVEEYAPGGMTALLDAMGRTIDETGKGLAEMSDADRPDKVIILVMTDGEENASREYMRDQVFEKVKHQQEKYHWNFLFLGAGLDAIDQGRAMGIPAAAAIRYDASSVCGNNQAYVAMNNAVTRGRVTSSAVPMSWEPEDWEANKPK